MDSFSIDLQEAPDPEDVQTIRQGLNAFNLQHAPDAEFRPLSLFLRDAEGKVAGGLLGGTYWGWLHVDLLWLDECVRRQGLGRQLLAAAEQEARQRGCHQAHLDTMSFQALPFYEKQGYTVWGVLEGQPAGHSRYFLRKELGEAVPEC